MSLLNLIVCVVTAGIEATREHTDKGTAIALLRVPRNEVSNVRKYESPEDKPKTADINAALMSWLMSARIPLTKRVMSLLTTLTLEMWTL